MFILYTPKGGIMFFYLKSCAEVYKSVYGGIIRIRTDEGELDLA